MYDIVFRNARVLDGTGAPWFVADVAVKNGHIVRVGKSLAESALTVDASGKYLAPGFIDAHSHSDQALVNNPTADSKVMQGVTLEIIGQCGSSAAPRDLSDTSPQAGLDDEAPGHEWTDMASYMSLLESKGVSVNVAPLVGHGTVRRRVMGVERRPPTTEELSRMKDLIREAMEQGAFGMSTGLIYIPGAYADTGEIVELAKVAAGYGGVYFTHMRNEGPRLLEALEEAISIGFEAGLPVQISHFKAMGKDNWGKVVEAIAKVEQAREDGLDITADQYPYIASSTGLSATVGAGIWAGGPEKASQILNDPAERQKIIDNLSLRDNWGNLVIASLENEADQQFIGKSVSQAAEILGVSPAEAALGLLERNQGVVQIVNFAISEDDVRTVMSVPWVMAGSDGSAINAKTAKGQPHPRSYGTFVRILGVYVRELRHLRLEEAVRKMTSLPAARLGLQDRGIIREGMRADLVLFDADTVKDRATFTAPHQYPTGIQCVVVNGVPVVENGEHNGNLPGMVLRRR